MSIHPATDDQITLARSKLWTADLDRLLRRWKDQTGKRQMGHSRQASKFSRKHYILGIPAVLLNAIVATGILSTFRNCDNCDDLDSPKCEADQWIRLAIGVLGIGGGALTALMTFMNYQEAAEQHKNSASDFENLHRVLETLLQVPGSIRGDPISTLNNLRDQYTSLVRGAPQLPKKYAVDLTYRVVTSQNGGPKPPDPNQVLINESAKPNSSPLRKLLDDEKSKTKAKINKIKSSVHSQESEEEEVVIGFDLDTTQSTSGHKAALQAALLATEREGQVQQSLSRALEFELQRLDTHVENATTDEDSEKAPESSPDQDSNNDSS